MEWLRLTAAVAALYYASCDSQLEAEIHRILAEALSEQAKAELRSTCSKFRVMFRGLKGLMLLSWRRKARTKQVGGAIYP